MPFKGEFYYFYLHLKDYLKNKHKIKCARADDTIEGQAFIDKIKDGIKNSDLIIADGSGGNPNVYYELAIAHESGKKVIHITQDKTEDIPSDTRHLDYVKYTFKNQNEFEEEIDKALEWQLKGIYEQSYANAKKIIKKFEDEENENLSLETKAEFIKKLKDREVNTKIPKSSESFEFSNYVFPLIVKNETVKLKAKFTTWLVKD